MGHLGVIIVPLLLSVAILALVAGAETIFAALRHLRRDVMGCVQPGDWMTVTGGTRDDLMWNGWLLCRQPVHP